MQQQQNASRMLEFMKRAKAMPNRPLTPTKPSNPIVGQPVTQPTGHHQQAMTQARQQTGLPSTPNPELVQQMQGMQAARNSQAQMHLARQQLGLTSTPNPGLIQQMQTKKIPDGLGQTIGSDPNKTPFAPGNAKRTMPTPLPQQPTAMPYKPNPIAPPQPVNSVLKTGTAPTKVNYSTTRAAVASNTAPKPTATASAALSTPSKSVQAEIDKIPPAQRKEIERKAKAGIPMDKPTPGKNWLYESYKKQPTAAKPTASAVLSAPSKELQAEIDKIPPAQRKEIERKAKAGIPMDKPTPAKNWVYDSFKKAATPATPATPPAATQPGAPVTPTNPATPATPTPITEQGAPMAGPVDNGKANWNANQSIPDYLGMTEGMFQDLWGMYMNGKPYDPATDPAYQATMQLATKQADAAGLSTMEDMNERGILNSTVTSDRVGQIKQGASDAVIGNIPGFQANYNNHLTNTQINMQNTLNSALGAGQFQQTHAEGNRQFDKNYQLDEAATTGKYISAEGQNHVNIILNAKRANEDPNVSPAERKQNAVNANNSRAALAAMGIDVSGIDWNVSYADAIKNAANIGKQTLEAADIYADNKAEERRIALDEKTLKEDTAYKNKDLALREAEVKLKADLESRGLSIEEGKNAIDLINAQSDADYKLHLRDNDITEQKAKESTSKAIGYIAGATTFAEGLGFINSQKGAWSASGVDMKEVVNALYKMFPQEAEVLQSGIGAIAP